MNEHHNRVSLFWPVVLIGAGVILLLRNLGFIQPFDVQMLLRLWPLILVVIGLDLIFARKAAWVGGLIGLLAIGAVIAFIFYSPMLGIETSAGVKTESFSSPVENAKTVEYHINGSSAPVELDATAAGTDLVNATFTHKGTINYEVLGKEDKTVRISETPPTEAWLQFDFDFSPQKWDIALNPDVLSTLYFDGGSGAIDLDLTGMNLEMLQADFGSGAAFFNDTATTETYTARLESGSGAIDVDLPANTTLDMTLESGSGAVTVSLPAGAGIQIEVMDDGSGAVRVPDGFTITTQSGNSDYSSWQSPGYATAAEKVTIRVIERGSGALFFKYD